MIGPNATVWTFINLLSSKCFVTVLYYVLSLLHNLLWYIITFIMMIYHCFGPSIEPDWLKTDCVLYFHTDILAVAHLNCQHLAFACVRVCVCVCVRVCLIVRLIWKMLIQSELKNRLKKCLIFQRKSVSGWALFKHHSCFVFIQMICHLYFYLGVWLFFVDLCETGHKRGPSSPRGGETDSSVSIINWFTFLHKRSLWECESSTYYVGVIDWLIDCIWPSLYS